MVDVEHLGGARSRRLREGRNPWRDAPTRDPDGAVHAGRESPLHLPLTHRLDAATLIAKYTHPTRFGALHCRPVAIYLERAAPSDLSPVQREALRAVAERAQEVESLFLARERSVPPKLTEPRNRVLMAWSAMQAALLTLARVPDSVPERADAERLATLLLPAGIPFGRDSADVVWSESRRLLKRIEDEGMAASIDSLIHPAFLRAVRRSHDELGVATGLAPGVPLRAQPPRDTLAEAATRFASAVSRYARSLSLEVDEDDEASIHRFVHAMHVIDALRVSSTRRRNEEDRDAGPAPRPPPVA
ncbi:MAG: hypothetical protein J0L92_25920 [Deltaproteobacteria bacterium]|nr:hypothetical protein [Deltaproteobacteria bacterium]